MSPERRTSNGRRWPRKKPRPDRWTTFRFLVLREAFYTAAANPLTPTRNEQFRRDLCNWRDDEVISAFRAFIEFWPARNNRP